MLRAGSDQGISPSSVSRPKSWVRDDLSPNSTCLICGGFVVNVVQLLIRCARLFVVDVRIGCATNQQWSSCFS